MIAGVVNTRLEPIVSIQIDDQTGQPHESAALVDTGFSGFLTLPLDRIQSLGLPWVFRQRGFLADGNARVFDVYSATVHWDGHSRTIPVEASENEPLMGMGLLRNHQLRVMIISGGSVEIEPLP